MTTINLQFDNSNPKNCPVCNHVTELNFPSYPEAQKAFENIILQMLQEKLNSNFKRQNLEQFRNIFWYSLGFFIFTIICWLADKTVIMVALTYWVISYGLLYVLQVILCDIIIKSANKRSLKKEITELIK